LVLILDDFLSHYFLVPSFIGLTTCLVARHCLLDFGMEDEVASEGCGSRGSENIKKPRMYSFVLLEEGDGGGNGSRCWKKKWWWRWSPLVDYFA